MKSRGSGGARKAGSSGRSGGSGKQGGSSKQGSSSQQGVASQQGARNSSSRGARPTGVLGGGLLGGVVGAAKTGGGAGGPTVRRQRLAGAIHKHISGELGRHLADPRLAAVGIERVELSPDMSIAKVYVRLMFGAAGIAEQRAALAALAGAGPGLRSSLGPLLRMRRVPELRFHYDVGAEKRAHIEGILAEIAHEDEAKRRQLGEQGGQISEAGHESNGSEPDDDEESENEPDDDEESENEPDDDED